MWLPPSATKSTDIDGIGRIVDVKDFGGLDDHDWVTAQLQKRAKYLDYVRARVRAGAYRLTAQLAKMLGLPFDQDAAELVPRSVTFGIGEIEAGRQMAGLPDDRVTAIAAEAAKRYADTGDMAAAMEGIAQAVRGRSLPIDPDTGLPIVGPH